MNLSVGLVGLPNAGKSTLFNALIRRQKAQIGKHPFTTISPNKGMVDIPDENLKYLADVAKNDYGKTPSIRSSKLTVIDIAGLIKGAHTGEGLGNEFLGHIREVDAIIHLVRAFKDEDIVHPMGSIDPKRDIGIIETELLLSDLSLVERHLEGKELSERKPILKKFKDSLQKGIPARKVHLNQKERNILGYFPLLTEKPQIIVLNVNEADVSQTPRMLKEYQVIPISAKLEEELMELEPNEQREYLDSLDIKYSVLEAVLVAVYHLLDLVTFYTMAKGNEVAAWSVKANIPVQQAAGKVHSEMQHGFIKAEVINVGDLVNIGSWKKAQEFGKVNLVGREYPVKNGDVIEVKFSS